MLTTLSEVTLPDFIDRLVGPNTASHRDVRSLYAAKLSKLFGDDCDVRARNWSTFGVLNSENVIELTRKTYSTAVYSERVIEDDYFGEEMYFTPNGFSKASKMKLAQLSELCCVWVDLDVRDAKIERELTDSEVAKIHKDFATLLEADRSIPTPDFIISSGSGGLHLYWRFEPENANVRNTELWGMLKDRLNTLLLNPLSHSALFVDERGNDSPKRIMRIPGSMNIKYRQQCRAFQSDKVVEKRTLDELIHHLKIDTRQRSVPRVYSNRFNTSLIRREDFCRSNFSVPPKLSNHQTWCLKYANFVIPILLDGVEVKRGYRDLVAYSVVVCLRQLACPRSLIRQIIIEVNSKSIRFPKKMLLEYISTAMNKLYQAKSGDFIRNFTAGTGIATGHLVKKRKPSKRSRAAHAAYLSKQQREKTIERISSAIKEITESSENCFDIRLKDIAEKACMPPSSLRRCGLTKSSMWAWLAVVRSVR